MRYLGKFFCLSLGVCLATVAHGQAQPAVPTAAESDPVTMSWMQGAPPSPDKMIRFQDGSYFAFPRTRWSFSNWRELTPTAAISRGSAPARKLPYALRRDIDAISFMPIGGKSPMTWEQSLAANYTDGIVVLHKGRIVYERYFGALKPEGQHISFSVTKSFFGIVAGLLIKDGKIDSEKTVGFYLPELAGSGFGNATVRQVMDMTTALDYEENYVTPNEKSLLVAYAGGFVPRPKNHSGPESIYEALPVIGQAGVHGEKFTYRSPNTDVLAWIASRVSGKKPQQLLEDVFWRKMGMEQDGYMLVDSKGTGNAAGGLNLGLRDMARFSEMIRNGGRYNGQQIVPESVIADIRKGGSKAAFAGAGYHTLPGGSYRNQWWIKHDAHGVFMARGVYGQGIYIDPAAEMVIARFASHPLAGNINIDPTTLPAYQALAEHLRKQK
jgi:CubicO group peptidase (beta-lactamase class C family)